MPRSRPTDWTPVTLADKRSNSVIRYSQKTPVQAGGYYVIWDVPGESTLSKALDDIIIGRISRMINYVDNPSELLEQIDNLRYFAEKKRESLQPVSLSACQLTEGSS